VLLVHQGYTFVYIVGSDVDAPVYQYTEGASAARVADSFLAFLEAEVQAMERLGQTQRESGGYWIATDGTYVTETRPARANGERLWTLRTASHRGGRCGSEAAPGVCTTCVIA
jgi:hypothetical protein